MLTGRCKQDFELWMFNYFIEHRPDYSSSLIISKFERKTQLEKLAFYVEWFDNVGIYMSIEPNFSIFEQGNPFSCFRFFIDMIYYGQADTRQEATKAAIEKANELYNENLSDYEISNRNII